MLRNEVNPDTSAFGGSRENWAGVFKQRVGVLAQAQNKAPLQSRSDDPGSEGSRDSDAGKGVVLVHVIPARAEAQVGSALRSPG